jgi:hypothetical protein
VNTSDAVILGTVDSPEDAGYVTTRYQVRLSNTSMMIDAYLQCKDPSYII